jgi:hypothetical protein
MNKKEKMIEVNASSHHYEISYEKKMKIKYFHNNYHNYIMMMK